MGAALKGPWDADPDAPAQGAAVAGPWDQDEEAPGEMGAGEAVAHGFADMALAGWHDELQGAEDVAMHRLRSAATAILGGRGLSGAAGAITAPGVVKEYRQQRDAYRDATERARATNEGAFRVGQVGGLGASLLIPVPGSTATSLAGRVGSGALVGAASGLGSSEADLTKGEVGDAAADTGLGALVGGGVGAVAHGLGKAVDAIRGRAAAGSRLASADEAAAEYGKRYAAQKSAQGAFGGEAAAVQNRVGHWREVAANAEGHFTPAEVAQAQKMLASPEADAAIRRAGVNSMKEGGNRMSGSLQSAENAYDAARAAMDPAAIEAGAEAGLANPIRRELAPRAWTLGHRLLPVLLTGAGAAVGGPEGAVIGGGLGAVVALTQGRPGIIIRNAIRSPGVRKMVWDFVEASASSPALGKFGAMLQRAAMVGGARQALALHEALMMKDPEYAGAVERAIIETGGGQ